MKEKRKWKRKGKMKWLMYFGNFLFLADSFLRGKFYVYRLFVDYIVWLFELWRDYAVYPMVVYCLFRLVFVVTFDIKIEFIYFVVFMTIGIFLCYKYKFNWYYIMFFQRLLIFMYGRAIVMPALRFEKVAERDGSTYFGSHFQFDYDLYDSEQENVSMFMKMIKSLVSILYICLVYVSYFYIVEYSFFIFIYLLIISICIMMKWFYLLYFIALIFNLIKVMCTWRVFPKTKSRLQMMWKHEQFANGLIVFRKGGVVYLFLLMVGILNIIEMCESIARTYPWMNSDDKADLPGRMMMCWFQFCEQLDFDRNNVFFKNRYKFLNPQGEGIDPEVWEFDYYSNKLYVDILLVLLAISWFIYLVIKLIFW